MTDAIEMPKYDGMEYEELVAAAQFLWMENEKLRDAMYTNAGKYALQHMDVDELRIWATQQEYLIEKLRELVRDMMGFFEDGDWCVKCERARDCQAQEQYEDDCLMRFVFRDRMRELGIKVEHDD